MYQGTVMWDSAVFPNVRKWEYISSVARSQAICNLYGWGACEQGSLDDRAIPAAWP